MKRLEKIKIDLDEYRITLQFDGNKQPLTIHFDTPSRRFYFSLIAFIVNEMKSKGEPQFIQLQKYKKQLKLLDDSISGHHASKNIESMLAKIRVAWRNRLPNLDAAALFKILDRNLIPPYEKGGKFRYECSDLECDTWANLFSYDENNKWRFKFAIDSASITLSDINFSLGNLKGCAAWNEFLVRVSRRPESEHKEKKAFTGQWKGVALALIAFSIAGIVVLAAWYFYYHPGQLKEGIALPEKPSVAVLPFNNLSDDPNQEYFSDGITEEIISALTSVPGLFVIARNTTFTYKNKPINIKEIGEKLGVGYVLEGSVRKAGDTVRITAQLIDTKKGHHLWAQTYDRNLHDIFAVQDNITMSIITSMQVKLTEGEQIRIAAKDTDNLEAYLKYLQAFDYIYQFTAESNALGKQLAEEAIALDPNYAVAYNALAISHRMDVWLGTSKSPKQSMEKCMELSHKAIELDSSYADAYSTLAFTLAQIGKHEEAVITAQKAVSLNPNSAQAHKILAHSLRFAGRSDEAIPEYKKAIRLDPIPPSDYLFGLGMAYCWTGQYEEAIKWCKKAVLTSPDSYLPHLMLAAVYSIAGKKADARAESTEVLRIDPKFSVEKFEKRFKSKNKDLLINELLKVGLT